MILGHNNYVDSATITANSEASGYPVGNIQDVQLTKVYRSTGVTTEWIKFDLGSAKSIKGVFILAHNITSGATIKIQANTSDSWTSPAVDQTLTYDNETIYYLFSSAQSYQYWRFYVEDSGNSDGYIEIGRIELDELLELGDVISSEYPETIYRTDRTQFTLTGQVFGNEGISYKLWSLGMPFLRDTDKENLEAVYDEVGQIKPLILILYEDMINTYGIKYVVFNDNIAFNHIFKDIWNCNIAFREVF